jgi:hypothetical protein
MIDVLSECDPGIDLGWEAGILFANVKKDQQRRPFSHKPRGASSLAFSSVSVDLRLFTSVFVRCQRNDTRNDTRRNRLGGSLRKRPPKALRFPSSAGSAKLEYRYADGVWESRRRTR